MSFFEICAWVWPCVPVFLGLHEGQNSDSCSHFKRRLDVRLAVVVAACCKVPEHGLDDNGATYFCCPVRISMFDDINDWSWIWLVTPAHVWRHSL